MITMSMNSRAIFVATISIWIIYIFPALADVAGTLSSTTDTVITWIRAGAALLIIFCCFSALRGGGVLAALGILVALAAAVSARDIAALIQ